MICGCEFVKGENGDDEKKQRANGKSSVSTKRSRAAAIHNQSERVNVESSLEIATMIL